MKGKVVGLDLSLTATGLVTWSIAKQRHVVAEVIKAGSLRSEERLAFLVDAVVDRVSTTKPKLVVIEGYGFGARQSRAHSLGELGGVVRLALYQLGVPFVVAPPSTLKKFVTGKGNAPKDVMIKHVFKKWEFDTDDNNIADAYGLARLGEVVLFPRTKAHKALIKACDTTRTK